jgi:PAS domain S-box-containing protein
MGRVTPSAGAGRPTTSALPSAEALLAAVLETSDDAVVGVDSGGRITSWNQGAERLFGHAAEDILGRDFTRLFAAHVRDHLDAAVATASAGDHIRHLETEARRVDGLPVPISLSLCPVLGGRGEPVASLVIGRDITEQRLAQASLAEVERRVRESEALANLGSWLWDLRTGTVQWSDGFHRIHGVEPHDFDGTVDAHLASVHPEDRQGVESGMAASTESGRAFDAEYRIVRPGGEERTVHVRAQPMIGSDGAVVGLRGIGQDVTDRGRGA